MKRFRLNSLQLLLLIFLVLVGILVLAAFQTDPVTRSILKDKRCAAPCWQGIVPGETAESEIFDRLKASDIIRTNTIQERHLESTPASDSQYVFEFLAGGIGRVYVKDGRVSHIFLSRFEEPILGDFTREAGLLRVGY